MVLGWSAAAPLPAFLFQMSTGRHIHYQLKAFALNACHISSLHKPHQPSVPLEPAGPAGVCLSVPQADTVLVSINLLLPWIYAETCPNRVQSLSMCQSRCCCAESGSASAAVDAGRQPNARVQGLGRATSPTSAIDSGTAGDLLL